LPFVEPLPFAPPFPLACPFALPLPLPVALFGGVIGGGGVEWLALLLALGFPPCAFAGCAGDGTPLAAGDGVVGPVTAVGGGGFVAVHAEGLRSAHAAGDAWGAGAAELALFGGVGAGAEPGARPPPVASVGVAGCPAVGPTGAVPGLVVGVGW
jgi:hypothetical protein